MPSIGDTVPDATVMINTSDGPAPASAKELLPGFVLAADQLKDKGVEKIAVVSVNDAFVMGAWGRSERYAAVIEDGVFTVLDVEKQFVGHEVSTAEAVLTQL
jgi:glutaredoxin/glutathione-dependent peroxiredoxin